MLSLIMSPSTAKAPGSFATILIVLPSPFKGGEVRLKHAGQTKGLDLSPSSAYDISILAWYNDGVTPEIQPTTSGYLLALSYTIIHMSPNTPPPAIPRQKDMLPLYRCLQKWKYDGYATTPQTPLLVYLLQGDYSRQELRKGVKCSGGLEGKDASTVARLIPLAESLGIVVCLAKLKRTVIGVADDDGHAHRNRLAQQRKKGWTSDDNQESGDEEEETPPMGRVEEDEYKITSMLRVDEGDYDADLDFGAEFSIDPDSLVPEEAFEKILPDAEEYEGYTQFVRLRFHFLLHKLTHNLTLCDRGLGT